MITKALGEFAGSLRYGDLPDQVVHTVKLRIIDTLASAMAAVRLGRNRIIDELYVTPGEAAVWGSDRKRSVRDTTVLNSFRSHASYLDDGDRFSGAHPGCVVIPPLLALCSAEKRTGKELIASIVSGYEVLLRVGQAIYPSTVTRGFQSTAVLGAIGSAAGCANLMRLSPDAATSAIAIAANLGTGLKEALKTPESQPLQVARAAEGGLIAAMSAQLGLRGAAEIIEKGFAKAYADDADFSGVLATLGHQFLIENTYIKLHGGCRGCHAAIDVVDLLLASRDRRAAIERIEIAVDTVTYAGENHAPKTGDEAQFSIPFAVALSLHKHSTSPFEFTDDNLNNDQISNLMKKVNVKPDPNLDRHLPDKRGARAAILFETGEQITGSIDNAKGEPEFPLEAADLKRKFESLARPVLDSNTEQLFDRIMSLDDLQNASDLASYLTPPTKISVPSGAQASSASKLKRRS